MNAGGRWWEFRLGTKTLYRLFSAHKRIGLLLRRSRNFLQIFAGAVSREASSPHFFQFGFCSFIYRRRKLVAFLACRLAQNTSFPFFAACGCLLLL